MSSQNRTIVCLTLTLLIFGCADADVTRVDTAIQANTVGVAAALPAATGTTPNQGPALPRNADLDKSLDIPPEFHPPEVDLPAPLHDVSGNKILDRESELPHPGQIPGIPFDGFGTDSPAGLPPLPEFDPVKHLPLALPGLEDVPALPGLEDGHFPVPPQHGFEPTRNGDHSPASPELLGRAIDPQSIPQLPKVKTAPSPPDENLSARPSMFEPN